MTWEYIPEKHGMGVPEQWQCRVQGRSVAAVMRGLERDYQAIVQGPDGTLGSMLMTNTTLAVAQSEVQSSLVNMGWSING